MKLTGVGPILCQVSVEMKIANMPEITCKEMYTFLYENRCDNVLFHLLISNTLGHSFTKLIKKKLALLMKNMKHQRQRSMLLRFDFSNRNVASNRNEREKKNRLLSLDVARE